ncbi:MAG: type II/IV secretion system protein [Chloroflexi bacterium]|nr:type II/IV secretion system protein [Chloroflexota bacterium]
MPVKNEPGKFDWATLGADNAATSLIPEGLARRHLAFPARIEGNRLVVVMANPTDYAAIQALEARSRMEVVPLLGGVDDVMKAIDVHYSASVPDAFVEAVDVSFAGKTDGTARDVVREIPLVQDADLITDDPNSSPVIKVVDSLMAQAVKARATDIHVEPLEGRLRVRLRIDGLLQEVVTLPLAAHNAIVSRIKVMAGMDIAERRRPQDGHFAIRIGQTSVDVRAATGDTVHGEMVVLRLLNKSLKLFSLDGLGLSHAAAQGIRRMLAAPYGIMLVAGPTGAGKTTTLYASLNELDRKKLNIVTIEDPVEYRFEGINSMQINTKAGLTFANSLRAVLRLDPDVVLVGEIRDSETARIAVQAALTGHLVLSSIHANDATRAVTRIVDLEVEPFLLSSALLGVVGQRMIRKIDPHCAVAHWPEERDLQILDGKPSDPKARLHRGEGCYFCSSTGYFGRTGVFEVLVASDQFKSLVNKGAGHQELFAHAVTEGMVTIKQDAIQKALDGVTTPLEILRSVYAL